MKYEEYNRIIENGMVEYVKSGCSTFHIGMAVKEYIFKYDNDMLSHDYKKILSDKALQAMMAHKSLPDGVHLVKCIWHERKSE